MKKLSLLVGLLLICAVSYSQRFAKGRMLAGGSVSFSMITDKLKVSNTTTVGDKTTSFSFSPDAGYFIMDNLAVGAALPISISKSKPDAAGGTTQSATSIALGPFVRYYLDPGIFFQGMVAFGTAKSKLTSGSTTTEGKSGIFDWSLGAGYAYFLNDHVAVEPFIGFGTNTVSVDASNSKFINTGLALQVAFQIYLDSFK